MLDTFRLIFGDYTPVQSLVSGDPLNGDAVYFYSIDWSYIFALIIVCIIIYSFFRLVGILLGGSNR